MPEESNFDPVFHGQPQTHIKSLTFLGLRSLCTGRGDENCYGSSLADTIGSLPRAQTEAETASRLRNDTATGSLRTTRAQILIQSIELSSLDGDVPGVDLGYIRVRHLFALWAYAQGFAEE